jgi:DNA-binding NarL/FixJ family response regulator
MKTTIRVLIADDTLIGREGLKKILASQRDINIVGEVKVAHDLPRRVQGLQPDVLLTDLNWFGDESAGGSAIAKIKQIAPATKIIALTVYADLIPLARMQGADAALPKGFSKADLIKTIKAVHDLDDFPAPTHPSHSRSTSWPAHRNRNDPLYLAAAIGIPALGFILIAAELMLFIQYLSIPKFTAAVIPTMVIFFFGVIFAGRYVDIISETATYKLFINILHIFNMKVSGRRPTYRKEDSDE